MITVLIYKPNEMPENQRQKEMLICGAEFYLSVKREIVKDYKVRNTYSSLSLTIPNEVYHNAF